MAGVDSCIFREYDVRGRVEEQINPPTASLIGKAFGTYLRQRGGRTVIVGRDNRLSSDALATSLINGLLATGARVLDIGLVVTPIFYYAGILYAADGGVMVTGSHNPPDENGFKIVFHSGNLCGAELQELYRLITSEAFLHGPGTMEKRDPVPAYLAMIREKIKLGPRQLQVVVDAGNGAASFCAPSLLTSLGCRVIPLYCDADGTFPHHFPDPVIPGNLQDLIQVVRNSKADLGIAFDGDADRLGVVDANGRIIWADLLMILFWREILPRHPGAEVIVEVKCSQALIDEVTRLGGRPVFYRTGHSLIKKRMQATGAVFSGEMSGHLFFADEYFGYDDALYACARLLRILSHTSQSLSALLAGIPRYYATPETRVPCPDQAKFQVVEAIKARFAKRYPVITVDGARIIFPAGWGLVRASNTQPALVLRCEARTRAGMEKIKQELGTQLAAFSAVAPVRWDD